MPPIGYRSTLRIYFSGGLRSYQPKFPSVRAALALGFLNNARVLSHREEVECYSVPKIYVALIVFLGGVRSNCDRCRNGEKEQLAHREGRTRSLQIMVQVMARLCTRYKSLTLYPIELGGRLQMNPLGLLEATVLGVHALFTWSFQQ